jgi:methyl-accepting chemotaxis protein
MGVFKNLRINTKLMTMMLVAGLVPISLASFLAFNQTESALESETRGKLQAIMAIKKGQIEGWFGERFGDVSVLSSFYEVVDAVGHYDKAYADGGPKGAAYEKVNSYYDSVFRKYNKTYGYYDFFLISAKGDVVYSVTHEADFATNMVKGKYSDSGLAEAYRGAMSGKTTLTDFAGYAPSNGDPASFIAAPVKSKEGKTIGVVALQMPLGTINGIMQEKTGLGESGETYLIGHDKLMRSDSRFEKESTVLKKTVDTLGVREALAGKSDCKVFDDYRGIAVWSAYSKLKIAGLNWVLLAEIDEAEAMGPLASIRNMSLGVAGALGLLVAFIAFFFARSIARPLQQMTAAANDLAEGDLDQHISLDRGDEVGQLAEAFRTMIEAQQELASVADKISQGDLSADVNIRSDQDILSKSLQQCVEAVRALVEDANALANAGTAGELDERADVGRHQGEFARAIEGVNNTLDAVVEPIREAGVVLEALARFDLRARVTGAYQGDHARIKSFINTTAENLDAALAQVGQSTSQLEYASGQISDASQSLAQSSSEQASTQEEITATLQGLTEQINTASGDVDNARTQCEATKGSAEQGRKAMDQLAGALEDIKKSSDKTAKIVKTIDQIAFQTNVLALNAAVEAARAGEAGKGFAVVAEQVGRLAQRTAEASSTTSEMIEGAVKHSEQGVNLGEKVSELFAEIYIKATESDQLMGQVVVSASAQAEGVHQIHGAMDQVNTVTQGNAANAEQSAAAAEELNSQAAQLSETVGRFSLTNGPMMGHAGNRSPHLNGQGSWSPSPAAAAAGFHVDAPRLAAAPSPTNFSPGVEIPAGVNRRQSSPRPNGGPNNGHSVGSEQLVSLTENELNGFLND